MYIYMYRCLYVYKPTLPLEEGVLPFHWGRGSPLLMMRGGSPFSLKGMEVLHMYMHIYIYIYIYVHVYRGSRSFCLCLLFALSFCKAIINHVQSCGAQLAQSCETSTLSRPFSSALSAFSTCRLDNKSCDPASLSPRFPPPVSGPYGLWLGWSIWVW